jgi:hypothetical protein
MKKYGQSTDTYTTSIFDACLKEAFKNEYYEQHRMLNNKKISEEYRNIENENESIFNKFDLSKANQLFTFKNSKLFDDITLLFHDMMKVSPESVNTRRESNTSLSIYQNASSISKDNSFFNLLEIDQHMLYFDAVKFAYEMQKSSPGQLYGILLKDSHGFINPLHPLIAQSLTRKYKDPNNEREARRIEEKYYKVFVYAYNQDMVSSSTIDLYDNRLNDIFKNHIFKCLAVLEQTFTSSVKITRVYDVRHSSNYNRVSEKFASTFANLTYDYEEFFEDEQNKFDVNMEPVQVVNNGLVYPYYGIVGQKYSQNLSIRGYQLSPMLSPNIGRFAGMKTDNNGIETNSVVAGSICTGNLNKMSEAGWRSLNHANLNSAFFADILNYGSFSFANICIDISLNIYASYLGLEPLNSNLKVKSIPISFATFKEMFKDKSFIDYIQYTKDQGK